MKLADDISADEMVPADLDIEASETLLSTCTSIPTTSAIFCGTIRHRRFLPVLHGFNYRMFMMYLNLDELPHLFDKRWLWSANSANLAWFKRADYYGDANVSLKTAISDLLQHETGQAARGPICLLTHMRYFGHCFNPVSFYYCFEADGNTLQAIVTDITNTPWGERHAYVLDCTGDNATEQTGRERFRFRKLFHVSPFMPMEIDYDWSFSLPGLALHVHMQNKIAAETTAENAVSLNLNDMGLNNMQADNKPPSLSVSANKMFDATLSLNRQAITGKALAFMLLAYPLMTIKVIVAIYWQALLLSIKRVPFITHPLSPP